MKNVKARARYEIEMHFLPDINVKCDVCGGKKYNNQTLEILYNGKNIADVLNLSVSEALEFFKKNPTNHTKTKNDK